MKTKMKNIIRILPVLIIMLFGIGVAMIVNQTKHVQDSKAQGSVFIHVETTCNRIWGKVNPDGKYTVNFSGNDYKMGTPLAIPTINTNDKGEFDLAYTFPAGDFLFNGSTCNGRPCANDSTWPMFSCTAPAPAEPTAPPCVPNCECAGKTYTGQACMNGCGGWCDGFVPVPIPPVRTNPTPTNPTPTNPVNNPAPVNPVQPTPTTPVVNPVTNPTPAPVVTPATDCHAYDCDVKGCDAVAAPGCSYFYCSHTCEAKGKTIEEACEYKNADGSNAGIDPRKVKQCTSLLTYGFTLTNRNDDEGGATGRSAYPENYEPMQMGISSTNSVILYWEGGSTSCTAGGDWSGTKSNPGSEFVVMKQGVNTYELTCGSHSKKIILTNNSSDTSDHSGEFYTDAPAGDPNFKVQIAPSPYGSNTVWGLFQPIAQEGSVKEYQVFFKVYNTFVLRTTIAKGKEYSIDLIEKPIFQVRAVLNDGSFVYSPVVDAASCLMPMAEGWGSTLKPECKVTTIDTNQFYGYHPEAGNPVDSTISDGSTITEVTGTTATAPLTTLPNVNYSTATGNVTSQLTESPVVGDPARNSISTSATLSGNFNNSDSTCGKASFYAQGASKIKLYLDGNKDTGTKLFEGNLTDTSITDKGGTGPYGGHNYAYSFDQNTYKGEHRIYGYAIDASNKEIVFSNIGAFQCGTSIDNTNTATPSSNKTVTLFAGGKESMTAKIGDKISFSWNIKDLDPVNCFATWTDALSDKVGSKEITINDDYDQTYYVACLDSISKKYVSDSVKVTVDAASKIQTDEEREKEAKINTTNYLVIPERSPINCDETPENKFHGCYYNGIVQDLVYYPPMENVIGGEYIEGDVVNHEWGLGNLVTDTNGNKYGDYVSSIWRGRFYFEDGYYTFHSVTDDGMKVNVEGLGDILYKWYPQPRNAHNSDVYRMKAGWRTVTVRYFEQRDKATAKFWWDKESDLEDASIQAQLDTFQTLIADLQEIIDKILKFLGIK
jgi:hypothetical protein